MENPTNPPLPGGGSAGPGVVPPPPAKMVPEPPAKTAPEPPAELMAMQEKVMNDKDLANIDDDAKKEFVAQLYAVRRQEKKEKEAKETKEQGSEQEAPKKKHSFWDALSCVVVGLFAGLIGFALLAAGKDQGDSRVTVAGVAILAYAIWVFTGAFTGGWRLLIYPRP